VGKRRGEIGYVLTGSVPHLDQRCMFLASSRDGGPSSLEVGDVALVSAVLYSAKRVSPG
jgi:hypothetical protein